MPDLSVLIPARNEMFLTRTVEDILAHKRGATEVIVVLDGAPPVVELPTHQDLRVVQLEQSIGQRAATNYAARLSEARYVMKCDAHCAFDDGFDVKMMQDMHPDWTMVPKMYNLHAFDWVCQQCGQRRYQGPTPEKCPICGGGMQREIVWHAKTRPETTAMAFDRDLKFEYFGGYKARQKGDLVETMSLLGACWMLTRDRYWGLNICDEEHGSWGQQGTEVACKTWLSGGRLICTKKTWFAHMFRTQGGDFGFPYPLSGSQVDRARAYSRKLWLENTWSGAIHPLSWLVDKFAPVPGWEPRLTGHSKAMLYYTDNELDPTIALAVQKQLERCRNGHELISVSLRPLDFGRNIVVYGQRGPETMFRQILAGLEACTADVVYFTEHDVLYHPSHFEFVPGDGERFYYNQNAWRVDARTGHALFYYANATSGLCACRDLLLEHYRRRVQLVAERGFSRRMGYEPGTHGRPERVDDHGCEAWMAPKPNIDIRHGHNLTPSRWHKEQFRNQQYTRGWTEAEEVPGWGRWQDVLAGLVALDSATRMVSS